MKKLISLTTIALLAFSASALAARDFDRGINRCFDLNARERIVKTVKMSKKKNRGLGVWAHGAFPRVISLGYRVDYISQSDVKNIASNVKDSTICVKINVRLNTWKYAGRYFIGKKTYNTTVLTTRH